MRALPPQLLAELRHVPDFNEAAFIEAHQQQAVTSVRLHPLKGGQVHEAAMAVPWCAEGRYLDERPVFTLDPLYHAGAYYVQEASSMFLDYMFRQLVPERNSIRVLDLCAAPGGKSTLIASLLGNDSLLISNEVIRTRASILEENMTRWGYMNTWVTSNDPRDFKKLPGYFDVIVTDVPCSGSGLFRKDENALNEWSDANVQLCCERQQRIMADVWPSLKQDGIAIYATCSYSAAEDEILLDQLAEEYDLATLSVPVPDDWGIVTVSSPRHKMTGYRFFPDKVKGEGFFIAAFQKKEKTDSLKQSRHKPLHDKKAWEQSRFLLKQDDFTCLPIGDNSYTAIRPQHEIDFQLLSKILYLRKTGLALGTPAKEWIPAHEVALSIDRNSTLNSISLDRMQALKFLKKEDVSIDIPGKGWYVVTHEGRGLGWLKSIGKRFNNYLPKHWRIRMDINE